MTTSSGEILLLSESEDIFNSFFIFGSLISIVNLFVLFFKLSFIFIFFEINDLLFPLLSTISFLLLIFLLILDFENNFFLSLNNIVDFGGGLIIALYFIIF